MKENLIGKNKGLYVLVNGVGLYTSRAKVEEGLFSNTIHKEAFKVVIKAIESYPTKCTGHSMTLEIEGWKVEIEVLVL